MPIWRPSTTGRTSEKRHFNLKIVPEGIRDFGADQGYTPLDLVMAACGCDLDTAFGFLSTRLDWAPALINVEATVVETIMVQPAGPPVDKLDEYTNVPGAVGNIVDCITATARRPNRVLAFGASITIVGT